MRQDQRGLDLAAKSLRRRWWWRLSWLETFERSLEIFEADLDRLLGERSKAAVLAYFEFGSVHCSLFLLEPFRFHGIIESSPRGFLAFIGDRETDRAPAPSRGKERALQRQRSESHTFDERLNAEKARLQAKLECAKPGQHRDLLELKLRQIETALHIDSWVSSAGLQPPKLTLG